MQRKTFGQKIEFSSRRYEVHQSSKLTGRYPGRNKINFHQNYRLKINVKSEDFGFTSGLQC